MRRKQKNQLVPEELKKVLTEESVTEVERAIQGKIKLAVEAALANQDDLYANKLQGLITAIDKDHSRKLKKVVESIDINNTSKLKKVIKFYERSLSKDASKFKTKIVESISDYIEEFLNEAVPHKQILEATKNNTAMQVLSNLRKLLAVDATVMKESVKEAVLDGKQQLDKMSRALKKIKKENELLREAYTKTKTELILENKTAKLPSKKAEYLKRVLSDKTPKFIEENFEYTAKLFDRKETERISVIKEEAFERRQVKADAPKPQRVVKEQKQQSINPYLAELQRMK